jgi:group I intron endonuclease
MMYCVYKHTAPNGKIYIGLTCKKPSYRWQSGNGYKDNEYFWRAIQKYGWDNIKHEILFNNLTKQEACKKEIELIAQYKSNNNEYGYNLSSGGEFGSIGVKRSEEEKRRLSEFHRGKRLTEEHRKKLSDSHKGIKPTEESRKKRSESMKGKIRSEEYRRRISESKKGKINPSYGKTGALSHSSKSIKQIDKSGNVVKVFDGIMDAQRLLQLPNGAFKNISACARGKKKTAYGFDWEFVTEEKRDKKSIVRN